MKHTCANTDIPILIVDGVPNNGNYSFIELGSWLSTNKKKPAKRDWIRVLGIVIDIDTVCVCVDDQVKR